MRYSKIISVSVALAILALSVGASAKSSSKVDWRETFQSSPASYELELAETAPLSPEMRSYMRTTTTAPGTVRQRLSVTLGGNALRVRISNEEGNTALTIAASYIGVAEDGFAIKEETKRRLQFGGKDRIRVEPGKAILSDPVKFKIKPASELVVSLEVPFGVPLNPLGGGKLALASGDRIGSAVLKDEKILSGRPIVSGILVKTRKSSQIIVALGDSITDANRHLLQGNNKAWPEYLYARMMAQGLGDAFAVANAGIAGNRVLRPGMGQAALVRFDRDVGALEGVSHLIMLEGINDISFSGSSPMFGESPPVSARELIDAYKDIIARSHARGIKVYLGTLLPFKGSTAYSEEREATRAQVNAWIRRGESFDGVIDFDMAMRSPAEPLRLDTRYDIGDGLHPNDAGQKAMADVIDIAIFENDRM